MADEGWASVIRGALFGRKQQQDAVPKDFWLSDSRRVRAAACACAAAQRGVRGCVH
jgi:hypothetical protein